MSKILEQISEELINGKTKVVKELVAQALSEGIPAKDILDKALLAGIDVVSEKFKTNEMYVPEVIISSRAMTAGMELLKPHLGETDAKPIGKAVIGTVKGDLHDIGKNIVRMMFEGKGIEVIDLGVDVSPEDFLKAHKENKVDIVALSALLTTTMDEMTNTVNAFVEAGLRDEVIFMIGGTPVTEAFRKIAGADFYATDAATASDIAKQELFKRRGATV